MKKYQVAYIPIGVPTFHLESAQIEFDKSVKLIRSITKNGVYPKQMLLSIDDLNAFLDKINPDLIILQNITFANSAYCSEVMKRFSCPVLLWTLREPVIDGGRLRLNSLTGAYSAANVMKNLGVENFEYLFGAPQEKEVKEKIAAAVAAAEMKYRMKGLTLAAIGHTPQGFGFGRATDAEMQKNFGITLNSIEARELIDKAKSYTDEECTAYLADAEKSMCGLDKIPAKNVKDFARLFKAYKDYVTENHIGAIASRCWPDFFTSFGTPVCAVLAMLNDLGVAAACESDCCGAVSMYLGMQLTNGPVFFGDPVSMDENENTVTYWHCGTAACSLAREDTGAEVGKHCNRHIGPTLEFGCRPCEQVTVFRAGRKPDGTFRFFLADGEALDKPKQFLGTSVVVKMKNSAKDLVEKSVEDGWEPHFVVVYGNVSAELEILAHMLGMEVCRY
jgi:L-fucose isomerase-like protein